jgi:CBS-domain-containing membrane protein
MAHAPGVYTCQATASLEELVKMLGAPQHGIHRVYVVDPDQRPAGVVTGTDVLHLLSTACSRE